MRAQAPAGPLADPLERRAECRAWYVYDWANSAYLTTVATVLLGPYVTRLAEQAACGRVGTDADPCRESLDVVGLGVAPGSLWLYVVSIGTALSAFLLPFVGAYADRTQSRRRLLAGFAWAGSLATGLLFVITKPWWLVVPVALLGGLCAACAQVVYNAILNDISASEERDRVSSMGWGIGYLGAGVMLAGNLVYLRTAEASGVELSQAARWCFVGAALWWAGWTLVPFLRLRDRPPRGVRTSDGTAASALGQLVVTLRHLRGYPQALAFLLAYVFFIDGIQVLLASTAVYATEELRHPASVVVAAVLTVQFVAFFGSVLSGRLAGRVGAKPTLMGGIVMWCLLTLGAWALPARNVPAYFALVAVTGLVIGGSQALSRSLFSRLIPRGREAEYFGLYSFGDRATSWIGILAFGLVFQATGSYRAAVLSTALAFVVGVVLLARVDVARGIRDAAA